MLIDDILDADAVEREISAGYVTERAHPEFPELRILNYTDKCQFDRHWNDVTGLARGLIYNNDSRELLARPFPKIHNHSEPDAHAVNPDSTIYGAFDKLDGSLGITYMRPDGLPAIATRGSFTSAQAIHATRWFQKFQWGGYLPYLEGQTWLWEIIYPENRIVVNYGDRDELVYLGAIRHMDGYYYPPGASSDAYISQAATMPARTLQEALSIPPRHNAEGMVVWLDAYRAVKIKQDDYVELHRIVSNLSEKEVWRQLRGGTFNEFAAALPDEFHDWARTTAALLYSHFARIKAAATAHTGSVRSQTLPTRKEQAMFITATFPPEYRGLIFALLDGKSIDDSVWRMVEPKQSAKEDSAS